MEMVQVSQDDIKKAREMAKGLKGVDSDFVTAINMLIDSFNGKYKLDVKTILLIAAAIAYLINPADAVPDPIPVAGFVDDAAVIGVTLVAVSDIIKKYKTWKAGRA